MSGKDPMAATDGVWRKWPTWKVACVWVAALLVGWSPCALAAYFLFRSVMLP